MLYIFFLLVIIIPGLVITVGYFLSRIIYNVGLNPDWDSDKDIEDRAKVIEIDDSSLTLEIYQAAWGNLELNGIIGLKGDDFTCTSEKLLSKEKNKTTTVKRSYSNLNGTINEGDKLKVSFWPYHGTPIDRGVEYKEIKYKSNIGMMNAWYTEGRKSTCVIFVHGLRDSKKTSLGLLPLFKNLDYPTLTINYRNDKDNPKDPSGLYQYGITEWLDLEASVAYCIKNIADNVILFGYSMGAGIIVNFMKMSKLSGKTTAVILDSPNLNFAASVVQNGKSRYGIWVAPFILTAQFITSIKYKVNWKALDFTKDIQNIKVPILILHTTDDAWVPIHVSKDLAEKTDSIDLVEIPLGNHCKGWNADKKLYEKSVTDFLSKNPH
ncbi:MAG: alpha/beta hydrolase [Spirochaetales bacterium]|nr:alpha/beta hydrolase [Spirochaetales bacterium]